MLSTPAVFRRLGFAVVFTLLSASRTDAAHLAGTWKGTWTKAGDALPVMVTIEKTDRGYRGHFESDVLQVAGIPFATVAENGRQVQITLKGDTTTMAFDGTLTDDALDGTFIDGKTPGTFALSRVVGAVPTLRAEDVTFKDGAVTLAGTVILPPSPGRHPAILFLHGSGPEGRWANRWLAQKFATAGFVALITDKRGVGASTGDWHSAGFDTLAADAAAGIALLRARTDVDPTRVGIYGHSQGGTIAPLVAIKSHGLGFVIASAAGGIDPAAMEIYSVENAIGVAALPAAERKYADAYVRALVAVAYGGEPHAALDAMATRYKERSWFIPPPPPGDSYWSLSRDFARFQPASEWRKVRAPVLLVYGEKDERVPPRASLAAIEAALKAGGNDHVVVKLYPDADHTFTVIGASPGGWPHHVAGYAEFLVNWALEQR